MAIVIAWTEMDGTEPTGRMERFDGVNYRPQHRTVERARACVWLHKGTDEDTRKAEQHLATLTDAVRRAVYVLPADERDPLAVAKRRVMRAPALAPTPEGA